MFPRDLKNGVSNEEGKTEKRKEKNLFHQMHLVMMCANFCLCLIMRCREKKVKKFEKFQDIFSLASSASERSEQRGNAKINRKILSDNQDGDDRKRYGTMYSTTNYLTKDPWIEDWRVFLVRIPLQRDLTAVVVWLLLRSKVGRDVLVFH